MWLLIVGIDQEIQLYPPPLGSGLSRKTKNTQGYIYKPQLTSTNKQFKYSLKMSCNTIK